MFTFVTKSVIEMFQLQGWISELEFGYSEVIQHEKIEFIFKNNIIFEANV